MRAALLLGSSAHRAHLPSDLHICDDLSGPTRVAVCGDFVSLRAEGAQVDAALIERGAAALHHGSSRSLLLHLPYGVFYALLWCYALFDRNPPFTTAQLQALVLDEVFEDMDWEGEFDVEATPFETAISDTFTHPEYSKLRLEF